MQRYILNLHPDFLHVWNRDFCFFAVVAIAVVGPDVAALEAELEAELVAELNVAKLEMAELVAALPPFPCDATSAAPTLVSVVGDSTATMSKLKDSL